MILDLLLTGISQGLILSFLAYATMVPYRLLNFPDLSIDGSYPLGGAVCAVCLISGVHPVASIIFGVLSGGMLGIATSLVYLNLKINTLLAGIIISAMAYSVNLRIMKKPNISLFSTSGALESDGILLNISILLSLLIIFVTCLGLLLRTDYGLRLRAVGLNPNFAKKNNISIEAYTVLGLFIAGLFSGLAGSMMVQLQGYMDVGMGVGIIIHGLAALFIGEAIVGNNTINRQLVAPAVGAILYQQLQGLVLFIGLAPSDLRFFTGATVLAIVAIQKYTNNE